MKIQIAERLKPYSHTPGASCLIPGTTWKIEAFPTLIRIGKNYELHLHITGPVKDFTLEQDLEKNSVSVFGKAKEGYYRLHIQGGTGGIEIKALNVPPSFLVNGKPLRPKERLFFSDEVPFFLSSAWERLSLGVSKAQDWDLVLKRFDLKEILPVLFGLGQKIPYIKSTPLTGTGRLLKEGKLDSFCRAAFSHILVPRLVDEQHQGLLLPEAAIGDPALLIQEAFFFIRSLFFQQEKNRIHLLPDCSFDAGRMTNIQAKEVGVFDLEWASRTLRRAILRASTSGEIRLVLPKGLSSYRVATKASQKGARLQSEEPLLVEAGKTYFFDRFHK